MKRMRSRRAVFLLGLAAALSIGILLRLSTYRQLQDGARTRAVSDDDYYHLRRARENEYLTSAPRAENPSFIRIFFPSACDRPQ